MITVTVCSTTSRMMSTLSIPHLQRNQTIAAWKSEFIASTITLPDQQRRDILPVYINRYPGEQELAKIAVKQDAAFAELETLIEGEYLTPVSQRTFSIVNYWIPEYLHKKHTCSNFKLYKKAELAGVSTHVTLKKFFADIPQGSKIYEEQKANIKSGMAETDIVALLKVIQPKLKEMSQDNRKVLPEEEAFNATTSTTEDTMMPKWAESLHKDMQHIKSKMQRLTAESDWEESTDSEADSEQAYQYEKNGSKCPICNRKGHDRSTCFKRICKACKGYGHDEEQCPTPKNRAAAISKRKR